MLRSVTEEFIIKISLYRTVVYSKYLSVMNKKIYKSIKCVVQIIIL